MGHTSGLGHGPRHQGGGAATQRNCHILVVTDLIGHGTGHAAVLHLGRPELLSGGRIVGDEVALGRTAKHQSTRRGQQAATPPIGAPGFGLRDGIPCQKIIP